MWSKKITGTKNLGTLLYDRRSTDGPELPQIFAEKAAVTELEGKSKCPIFNPQASAEASLCELTSALTRTKSALQSWISKLSIRSHSGLRKKQLVQIARHEFMWKEKGSV